MMFRALMHRRIYGLQAMEKERDRNGENLG